MEEYTIGMSAEEEIRWCANRISELLRERNTETKDNAGNCRSCGFPSVYCRGLCRACYDRCLKHGSPDYVNVNLDRGVSEAKKKEVEKPWYVRFREDVLGYQSAVPNGLEEAVLHVLNMLSEREKAIVLSRYKEEKTLYEIEGEIGISREGVRQLVERVKKKVFVNQEMKMILEIGVEKAEEVKRASEIKEKRKNEIEIEKLKEKYGKIFGIVEQEDENCATPTEEDCPIDILDLDTRSYNGLKMAGIETIQDLIDFIGNPPDFERLFSLKNIGIGSVKKIKKSIGNIFGK